MIGNQVYKKLKAIDRDLKLIKKAADEDITISAEIPTKVINNLAFLVGTLNEIYTQLAPMIDTEDTPN